MSNLIKETVRTLRKNQTKTESLLWQAVRNRKLHGKKFLRQHPIRFELNGRQRFFVADFYCHEARLVVEIDGQIHQRQKDYDELRTYVIKTLGMKVIRFWNQEVERDLNAVLVKVSEHL